MEPRTSLVYVGVLLGFLAQVCTGARIDHVIIASSDVQKAAGVLRNKYGLVASATPGMISLRLPFATKAFDNGLFSKLIDCRSK